MDSRQRGIRHEARDDRSHDLEGGTRLGLGLRHDVEKLRRRLAALNQLHLLFLGKVRIGGLGQDLVELLHGRHLGGDRLRGGGFARRLSSRATLARCILRRRAGGQGSRGTQSQDGGAQLEGFHKYSSRRGSWFIPFTLAPANPALGFPRRCAPVVACWHDFCTHRHRRHHRLYDGP